MTNHQDAADEKGKCKLIWAAHKQKHTMCICVTLICIRLHEWSCVNMWICSTIQIQIHIQNTKYKQKHTMSICVTLICIRLHEWSLVNMQICSTIKNTKYKIQNTKTQNTKTQTNNVHLLCDTGLASACMSAGANMFKCIELILGHRDPI